MSDQLTNRLIKTVSYIGLFLLFALPAYFWSDLPEVIPIHYGANGQPDGFGKKSTLWVLAIIAGFLFLIIQQVNQYPQYFNYPVAVTEKNKKTLYRQAQQLMSFVNAYVVFLFLYIEWKTIQVARGLADGLGTYFLVVVFLPVLLGAGFAIKQIFRKRNGPS